MSVSKNRVRAAVTGLFAGLTLATLPGIALADPGSAPNGCGGKGGCGAAKAPGSMPGSMPTSMPAAKHACKGHNACKGQGGCKSGDNGCAGKNSCKGHGGCAVPAKTP